MTLDDQCGLTMKDTVMVPLGHELREYDRHHDMLAIRLELTDVAE